MKSKGIKKAFNSALAFLIIGSTVLPSLSQPILSEAAAVGDKWNYNYTGSVQTWTAPVDGKYTLNAQGSQGGGSTGGKGGGVTGQINLKAGEKLYIYVGGQNGYNGGGAGQFYGGGATDIRHNSTSLSARLLVGAGGGGASSSISGGSGGNGDASGGISVGAGVGESGINGGGGGSSYDYSSGGSVLSYQYDEKATETAKDLSLFTMAISRPPITVDPCEIDPDCKPATTKPGYPGTGGSNMLSTQVTSTTNSIGVRSGNGFASITLSQVLDLTAPSAPLFVPSTTSPTNQNVYVTINYPADASVRQYRINGGTWTSYSSAVLMTANGKVEARGQDSAGNWSSISTYNVSNIDKTAPFAPSYSIVTISESSKKVTINYPADATVKQYRIDGGTWTTYSTAFSVYDNVKIEARGQDNAGNWSSISTYNVTGIDTTPPTTPTFSASPTTKTRGNVAVTINYSSDSSVKEYRINGGTWTSYSTAVSMTANGKVEARGKDTAGNYSAIGVYNVSNIDKTPPASATFSQDVTALTNGNVNVTIHYPADAVTKQYKIGSTGTWTTYSVPVLVTADNTVVYARSYDDVGNLSSESNHTVTNIDKVAPTTPSLTPSTTAITGGNVSVSISYPSDAVTKQYRINGGTWTAYSTAVTMTANGKVEARAIDSAGNVSGIGSLSISNIDKINPANATLSASTTAPTNQSVTVTIAYPSDATVKQYKVGSTGTWTSYSTPVVLSSNNTVYARSYDEAGNISNETSLTVSNIDKTPPTVPTFSATPTTATSGNVAVTISYSSDSSVKEYRINGGTWTAYSTAVTMTGNGKVEARGKDVAGNYSTIGSYSVSNIDKTPPANATFSPSTTSPTNGSVIVTINYPADAVTKQYKISSTGTWTTYSSPVSLSSNNTVYARSMDGVGNVSNETSLAVSNIDKAPPTTPTFSQTPTTVTKENVSVTINFSSDSVEKEYRINGGTWTAYSSAVSMTANGKVEARGKDSAGNYSAIGVHNVSNIDKTPPASATFSQDVTSPTTGHVNVTIAYPADAVTKQYKIGSTGTWTSYSSPVLVTTDNTVVYARSYDQAGNVSSESSHTVTNIDRVAPSVPTLTPSTTALTNGDVSVSISYPSDAFAKQYRLNGGTWNSYTTAVVISSNGTVEARAIDQAGNISATGTLSVTNIDKTPPSHPTVTSSTTSPTKNSVTLTVTPPSDAVKTTWQYEAGDLTVKTVTGNAPFTIVVNNNATIFFRTFDSVNNVSSVMTYKVTNIDTVPPTTPTLSQTPTTATNENVSVSISFSADSSVKEYRVNGGAWNTYSSPVSMTANGKVEARGFDVAGNVSSIGVHNVTNIDKTPPASATFSQNVTSPTMDNVTVTISYPADATTKQYKIGSTGTWTTYTTPVVVSSNNTVYARSYDAVGNLSSESNHAVSNIDRVAPTTPSLSPSTTSQTNQNVNVTISYSADSVTKQYRINGGTWTSYSSAVVMSANGKVEARSIDQAGNVSGIGLLTISNIDKTAPVNATFSPSTTNPTNQNVSLTISYPSDANVKEYKIGSTGTWTAYSTPVLVSANTTVYARSEDAVGNMSGESSYVVNNIDKQPPTTPTISADVTEVTNGNVVLTATFSNDSSVKEYKINGGTWTSYVNPVTMTGNGTFEVRGKDVAGNYSAVASYSVSNIDKTPPANATLTPSTNSPTNQNVSVTISYPADATVKQYKIGSTGTWTSYATPVIVSSNNTVYARSYDSVGNVSVETSVVVSNIDKIAPTTPSISADKTEATNGNVVLTATFSADSSVKEYRLNGGTWTSYVNPITMTANGTFEARGKDPAGNYSTVASYSVSNIDKTPPANATFVADKTQPTNTDVKVTINYPADSSVKQYKIGSSGTWTTYSTPIVVSSNNTVFARSYDAVGNLSSESNYVVSNIDKVAPTTPQITADKVTPTNGNVVLTATFSNDSSVKEYRINSGTWASYVNPVEMTGNGTFEVRGKDVAGNYSAIATYNVTNIDKVAPVNATFAPSTTSPTNKDVTVTISYPADATTKQYKIGSTGTWINYTTPVVVSNNNTVYARSYDAVGNVSNETNVVISNIDKVVPTTPVLVADKTNATNTNVLVTINYPSDSSVKEFRVDGGAWQAYSTPVVMTANGKVEARAFDVADNVSSIGTLTVSNIDKTAPAKATLTANTVSPTNQSVTVTIGYPADASVKQYKIGSTGTWTSYSTPVVVNENTTVYARSIDAVGNVSAESSFVVTNIDKTAPSTPTLVADVTEPTNQDVKVTVTYPSDATVKEIRINGGSWTSYATPVVMSANGKVEARAKDVAGNYSAIGSFQLSNIDKTAPTNPTFVASTTAPTNQDVTVSVQFSTDTTVKQYKVGSTGTWTAYSTPVVLSANNTIYARGYDAVGNVSGEVSFNVKNIDKVSPNAPTLSADKTNPTNTNVVVSAQFPSDASVKQVRVNNGVWENYVSAITLTENGKVEARSIDQAGNVSAIATYSVTNIDKVAPVKPVLNADKTASTNTDVKVTATFSNDSATKEIRVNSGSWTSYTTPVVMTSNGKVEARSFDNAGNVSSIESYQVSNIDKVKPVVATFQADKTIPTNKNVTVTITFPTDAVKKEVRVNNGDWVAYVSPVVFTENGKVEARSYDNATNVSDVSFYNVTNIDKNVPELPTYSVVTSENKITLTDADGDKIYYRVNDGEWVEYSETIVTEDGSYKVDFKVVDLAGNSSGVVSIEVEMYRDALVEAEKAVKEAETNPTQENVDSAKEKVEALPEDASELESLTDRVEDVQDVVDAQEAINKAIETRNEQDLEDAKEKIDLLDGTNPIVIDILDDLQSDFEKADILTNVSKERYDVLSSKYGMSKPSYTALVQIYYAIKYTGDNMYKMAQDKVALVPATDKHYQFVYEQFAELSEDYGKFVEEREQTDAEIKAEASVQTMEKSYDPSYALHTQELINAVEDEEVRLSLQKRLDDAKAKYEASLLDKSSQNAVTAVEKAESTKQSYYITDAYNKVNALTDETLKAELTARLQALETQIALDKQIADATRYVGLAEQYKTQSYIDTAQSKVTALPEGEVKTDLQQRIDVVKASMPTADQEKIIKNATSYVSLAQTMKTQYYVDKAQGYVDQILDEMKKAELQAKLDAIVVK